MADYKIGETVVHWAYGSGKIVAVDENGRSSLHLPTSDPTSIC